MPHTRAAEADDRLLWRENPQHRTAVDVLERQIDEMRARIDGDRVRVGRFDLPHSAERCTIRHKGAEDSGFRGNVQPAPLRIPC